MHIDFLLKNFKKKPSKKAIIWNEESITYDALIEKIFYFDKILKKNKIKSGSVVSLCGDFTPNSISLMLSLIQMNCIIVPLNNTSKNDFKTHFSIAEVQYKIEIDKKDRFNIEKLNDKKIINEHLKKINKINKPGLVLFTSGTSGNPKAAVHDFSLLLKKFKIKKPAFRTVNFLLFDHWGGLNTMFYILSSGGTVISLRDRKPKSVCRLIEKYKIELLPASPSFLNLMLLSKSYLDFDLKSLKIISYGTEPMPKSTLALLNEIFPYVKLTQTYGLIELGVMQSKSKDNNSLWFKVGGLGYKTRVVDNMLEIKAESAMLGYLNAPSPFTKDGWFKTGDKVLQKGEYIKILGRESEIINVGGDKVYPQEVENVILEMEDVKDITVYGEKNPLIGNIICAKISLINIQNKKSFYKKMKKHCEQKLANFKIPIKIKLTTENQVNERFKKRRA